MARKLAEVKHSPKVPKRRGRPPKNPQGSAKGGANSRSSSRSARDSSTQSSSNGGGHKLEIIAIIVVVLGLLAALGVWTPWVGIFGNWTKTFLKGLFGMLAYIVPLFIIAVGIHIGSTHRSGKLGAKYWLALISFASFSGIWHTFFQHQLSNISLPEVYRTGVGGGFFGALIANPLASFAGQVGAVIILVTVAVVFSMIVFDFSITKAFATMGASLQDFWDSLSENDDYFENSEESINSDDIPLKNGKIVTLDVNQQIAANAANEMKNAQNITVLPRKNNEMFDYENYDDTAPPFDMDDPAGYYNSEFTKQSGFIDRHNHLPTNNENFEAADSVKDKILPMGTTLMPEDIVLEKPDKKAEKEKSAVAMAQAAKEIVDALENETISSEVNYKLPPLSILNENKQVHNKRQMQVLESTAKKLIDTLESFGVKAKITDYSMGPTVTRYELQPSAGVKISKIVNLADDIALNLAANGVRIEAPIPGKAAVGIEIPNKNPSLVPFRSVIETKEFTQFPSKVSFGLGKDISGEPVIIDISRMPHLLVAGSTGSGKSVCINTLITSILYKSTPNEVKMIMVDPKMVELGRYNGIPHLLIPVVTNPHKAAGALKWAVKEMTQRYKLFADNNVRDLSGYNALMKKSNQTQMPQVVIIIDELADLMMVAPNDVEDCICRLAQMARAAGMYLVIATQRPSVDVITGTIKANIPSRISFAVSSQVDSRTILDMVGAEKLLGRGDMLYSPIGSNKPQRIQGGFLTDSEVENVVEFVKKQDNDTTYDQEVVEEVDKFQANISIKSDGARGGSNDSAGGSDDENADDPLLYRALEMALDAGQASASMYQRKLKLGYQRAARIIDQMEQRGFIGKFEGTKPRQLLITKQDFLELRAREGTPPNDETAV
ncbi:MAG: DNA translocase FtsK [Clostridiales bacterium]|nr:DNA translocase FtsK [Clostridiales bacterium]